ncbi:MAG TPA: hypothetical protein VKB38_13135 [Terracidiphilus sp.]|nr:hypothetical protein [Terracidiphilus sp.]
MPNLQRPTGKFLSTEDVSTGDIVTFVDAGVEKEEADKFNPGKKKLKFEIGVRLPEGDEKVVSLNNTSKAALMDAYGENSDEWVGKDARVEIITQKVGNDFKDVLYLTHPTKNVKGDIITA